VLRIFWPVWPRQRPDRIESANSTCGPGNLVYLADYVDPVDQDLLTDGCRNAKCSTARFSVK